METDERYGPESSGELYTGCGVFHPGGEKINPRLEGDLPGVKKGCPRVCEPEFPYASRTAFFSFLRAEIA